MDFLFWLSLGLLAMNLFFAFQMWYAGKQMERLVTCGYHDAPQPKISIIVAARNEALSMDQAVRTLLIQDYPDFELIVVNDRSTDETPAILNRLQAEYPNLQVVTITELPRGWLGKCHAMHQGAKLATGEWLLFTDGDVSMTPDTLSRSIGYIQKEKGDHLALAPFCILPSWIMKAVVASFVVFFKMLVKPSQIKHPNRKAHVGIGAFNLIRKGTYDSFGGHEPIRLRPDDDLKLGKLVKLNGFHQRFANGFGLVSVPWYRSVGELVRGLEKNSFAGMDYSYSTWVAANVLLSTVFVVPFVLVAFTNGVSFGLLLACCLTILTMGVSNAITAGYKVSHGLFFPLGVVFFLYVMNRAIFLTLWRRGIYWRDSFYSLSDLKSNVV
jgi:glycosyltransferase involved in cell wall biosynthesis